jgi:TonB-dependent starch-binding outer membrane protein SusC
VRLLDERLLLRAAARRAQQRERRHRQVLRLPEGRHSYRFLDLIGAGSEIKLRAAYGETGNQPLFGQKFTNLTTPQLGGQQGVTVSTIAGFDGVEPERLKEIEGGIDGSAMNGRLFWELTGSTATRRTCCCSGCRRRRRASRARSSTAASSATRASRRCSATRRS